MRFIALPISQHRRRMATRTVFIFQERCPLFIAAMNCEKIPNAFRTTCHHRAAFQQVIDLIFRDEMLYFGQSSQVSRILPQWQGQRFQLLLQAIQLMIPKT